ncbi:nickel-dependent hydrogenase large subunit [Pseudorhodoferax sp.]|uniref:nickel-dependent hydrogenase large subunit n=1 Tax=Pseudorhodoferax sp. TaxID=1993553 RepID=UPI002DD640FA|nr:nickel-dependent hydrogenase large subunit [Pseudorhodoferax sp.]
MDTPTRLVVGPFNRVEGDLEVRLDVQAGRVASAEVVAPMYRGFENLLEGRAPHDALVIVPRICGICSVSQSVAAARALADAAGVTPPPNGRIVTDLMLATENLADHLTHFYLFFMPDFAREVYAHEPWFGEVQRRFEAGRGEQARAAIAARQRWFQIIGTLGGKWPHTHSVVPGGSARAIDAAERLRLLAQVREFRAFLERHTFGAPLEEVAALPDEAALQAWHAADPGRGDLRLFLTVAAGTGLDRLGRGPGRYLTHGNASAPAGLWDEATGGVQVPDLAGVTEDLSHAWLADDSPAPRHPSAGLTRPDADKPGAYTWNKAPRLAGRSVETGAIARRLMAGQPLVRAAVARGGGTVYTRVLARLLELATVLSQMEGWLAQIRPGDAFCASEAPLTQGRGCGLTEAARGALGHWVHIDNGRIAGYQIVAPTSWNFSPRDAAGQPGPLEAALVGTPVLSGERTPVAVQHVVRSFDPCMVCTVH